jgi:dienelactone hydrolase
MLDHRAAKLALSLLLLCAWAASQAQPPRAVDIPTRPGVTQSFLFVAPDKPKAVAVLFAGGAGDFNVAPDGSVTRQKGNFLVRSRNLFVERGIAVAVIAPPSDRQDLQGFRQTREHVEDIRAVIAWLRRETGAPVWLVGTSRGTQSAAYVATELPASAGGADGLVLTSTVLNSNARNIDRAVPAMPLERVAVPVLVVHHKLDGCRVCPFTDVPRLMDKLTASPRKELIAIEGGVSDGNPCEAFAHHGYNGVEPEVVGKIAAWIAP